MTINKYVCSVVDIIAFMIAVALKHYNYRCIVGTADSPTLCCCWWLYVKQTTQKSDIISASDIKLGGGGTLCVLNGDIVLFESSDHPD